MGKEPEEKSLHPCSFASFSKMGVASITSFGLLLYKSLKNVNKYQSAELKTFKAQNVTLELKKKTSFHVNQSIFIVMDKDVGM